MSAHVAAGLACAIGATGFYGTAPVAQAVAARRISSNAGLGRLIWRLVREPIWLAGLGCELGGFGLEAIAFGQAPATLVAPTMACDMLVFLAVAWLVFGWRPTSRGLTGVTAMAVGVGLLALSFASHPQLGAPASAGAQIGFLIAAAALAIVAAAAGRLAPGSRAGLSAAVFGVSAGLLYGLATLATRQVGRTFAIADPWHLLVTPTLYLLAVSSALAIVVLQRGLQADATLAYPLTSALGALLPVFVGIGMLGDQVPDHGPRVAFIAALVVIVAGVGLLGQDRARAERAEQAGGSAAAATTAPGPTEPERVDSR